MKCTATRGGTPGGWTWGKAGLLLRGSRRGDSVRVEWLLRFYEDHAFPTGFVGGEHRSRVLQAGLEKFRCERVRAAEDALRGPCRLLERRHGLADIVECGAGVLVERLCVSASKKPSRCCAELCPWHNAFSEPLNWTIHAPWYHEDSESE